MLPSQAFLRFPPIGEKENKREFRCLFGSQKFYQLKKIDAYKITNSLCQREFTIKRGFAIIPIHCIFFHPKQPKKKERVWIFFTSISHNVHSKKNCTKPICVAMKWIRILYGSQLCSTPNLNFLTH